MKALVLGGNGFIGSHLVDKLLAHEHDVRVFDRHADPFRHSLSNVEYVFGSFENHKLLSESLDGVDVVYHLICSTNPKTSNDDPAFDVSSNLINSIFLFEQCVAKGVKKVVFLSSGGAIYGNTQTSPIVETAETNPISSYGITKLAIEKYLHLFNHTSGLDYVILRPSNPYGPRQNVLKKQGLISVIIDKALRDEEIVVWGDGSAVRDYIYIDDLVDGIYRASMDSVEKVYNLGSGYGVSVNDLIGIVEHFVPSRLKVKYEEGRPFDVKNVFLDVSKAERDFGWKATTSLETGTYLTLGFIKGRV